MSSNTVTTHVSKRTIMGSKLKQLRKEGVLPANIFGKNVDSLAIQLELKTFYDLFDQVGETGLITMDVDGGEKRTVIVSAYDTDPLTGDVIHVDFRQVNLKEAITAQVPVELIGEAPVDEIGAVVVQNLDELEVEALPMDLPEKIEVDISVLENIGDSISVGDVDLGDKITLTAEPEIVIVMAQEVKEEPEEPEEIETLIEGEEGAEEGAEAGEEGEAKPEEGGEEKSE